MEWSHKEFYKRLPRYIQLLKHYNLGFNMFIKFNLNYNYKMYSPRKFKKGVCMFEGDEERIC